MTHSSDAAVTFPPFKYPNIFIQKLNDWLMAFSLKKEELKLNNQLKCLVIEIESRKLSLLLFLLDCDAIR
jgi:hypothetical protein